MTKKTNNKGFSLVELIIVIAIMAVLMVVLAPQLLRYVESSRLQRDNSAISEIANAVEIACANEDVMAEIDAAGATGVTIPVTGATGANKKISISTIDNNKAPKLKTELTATIGADPETSSRTYRTPDTGAITITITSTATGTVEVKVKGWADEVDGSGTDVKTF